MTKEHGLLFRSYVPSLVACLEDADSGVRETAKITVIDLFQYEETEPSWLSHLTDPVNRNAPPRALSDLKKQLQLHNVRKSIATSILSSVGLTAPVEQDLSPSMQSQARSDIFRP